VSEYASGGSVVCQPCLGELRAVLETDCEVCEDVLALTYDHDCWRLQCKSGCPPYAEGETILDVVKGWERRDGPFFHERRARPKGILLVDDLQISREDAAHLKALTMEAPADGRLQVWSTLHHESDFLPPPPWWHFWRWPGQAWFGVRLRVKLWRKRGQRR
jgi:hypothetical protein